MAKGQRPLLPADDERHLRELAESGSDTTKRRAQVILDWHDGRTAAESAKHVDVSENQIRYLLRLYREKGLDLFLVESEAAEQPAPPAKRASRKTGVHQVVDSVTEPSGEMSLDALCSKYHVDMRHARHIGAQALTLFDAAMSVHRLPANVKPLLEAAALVHNLAYVIDAPNHAQHGRDILLRQPIHGFSEDERRILACTVAFHRKKVHADREPVYYELPSDLRHDALALSAILRVADGLDSSQTQTTSIADVQVKPEEIVLVVDGNNARENAVQSQARADLWNQIFTTRIRVVPQADSAPPIDAMPDLSPGLNLSMSVARAGKAFVLHTLDRLDVLMKRVQSGDMGLLPSLVREASRLTEAVLLADAKDFRKETHWLLDTVEEARMLAALVERASLLVDDPDEPASSALVDRLNDWQRQAQEASRGLDLRRYTKLASDLRMALAEDVDLNENALIAFHVGSILWNHLAALRDVMENGTSVSQALDAARRLQDHLIAFRDLLGREVAQVLDMLAPFEGYLAAIHTTQAIITRLDAKPAKRGRKSAAPDSAIAVLRRTQDEALNTLADGLPSTWSAVNNVVFRRAFALAVALP
jgi:Homeodomain-like domain